MQEVSITLSIVFGTFLTKKIVERNLTRRYNGGHVIFFKLYGQTCL